MNQPNSSIRCPHCNLLNFASDQFCKRCKNSLQNFNSSGNPNSININISFPNSGQPQINAQSRNTYQTNPQFQPPQIAQPTQPQIDQTAQNPVENGQSSEYQLLNQTGFEQWQQENKQNNPPNNQANNQNNYQPNYAPNYQQNYPVQAFPPPFQNQMQTTAVWRRGSEVVLHKYGGMLPDSCVKCGEHTGGYSGGAYVSQKYRWHSPFVYIALVSPLIYVILAAALSQRVQIEVPLCAKHLEARKSTGKFLLGGGIAAIVAIFFFGSFGYVGFALLIFLASLIGIVLGYEYSYKPLQVSKIENDYVYLKNADPRFLNRLPY